MSDFSLNTNFNFDDKVLAVFAENAYLDVANLIYTNMSYNSELDDLLFLNSYITQTFTKYYAVLEYLGAFNDKVEIQRFVDISASITSATVECFYKTNLSEALRFFINQFLKVVYDGAEFIVINIQLNASNTRQHIYKIIVEPVVLNGENVCDPINVNQLCELIIMLLSYAESPSRCMSAGILKSDLWIKNNDGFPEIADDSMFPGLFENYPALYKILFKSRYNVLKDSGIDSIDLSEKIELDEEAMSMYNNIIEISKNQEYSNNTDIEIELSEYSKIIANLYYKNINKNKPYITTIKFEDMNRDYSIEVPVYIEMLTALEENRFNTWTIPKLVKHYYDDFTGEDGYLVEPLTDEEKSKLIDLLDLLKDTNDIDTNIDIDDNTNNDIKGNNKNEKISNKNLTDKIVDNNKVKLESVDLDNLKVSEFNPSEKLIDGYQAFVPDYHSINEIKLVYDLKDYIESTLGIYINSNGKVNAPLIQKIVKSYNGGNIEVINIKDNRNRCVAELKDSNDNIFRLTISKKDGKIERIENKVK